MQDNNYIFLIRMPNFKLGSKTHYLKSELRDTSPGKSSLNAAEEQSSSLSEQAWDSYQVRIIIIVYLLVVVLIDFILIEGKIFIGSL